MACEREIKGVFPKFTRIEIIENNLGYSLKRKGVNEVLDITFKNASEAIQHAISEHWIIITGRRSHSHDTNYDKLVMGFKDINNKFFQWVSGKATLFTRLLHKYPSNVYRQYPGPERRQIKLPYLGLERRQIN